MLALFATGCTCNDNNRYHDRKILGKRPSRIVSTFLGGDEVLLAVIPKDQRQRLVGLSQLVDNAKYSNVSAPKEIPRVGDSVEFLLSLNPDLVILASYNRPEIQTRLKQFGKKFIVLSGFKTIEDIISNIRVISKATNEEENGENLISQMRQALNQLAKKHVSMPPKILGLNINGTVGGTDTLMSNIIRIAGGENAAQSLGITGWQTLNPEVAASLNPDWILIGAEKKDQPLISSKLRQTIGWKRIPAIQKNKFIFVPPRLLSSVSQYVLKAPVIIQERIWPEK